MSMIHILLKRLRCVFRVFVNFGNWRDRSISPRAQNPNFWFLVKLFLLSSFSINSLEESHHLHWKSSISAKLNPEPILDLYPMHLNNLLLRIGLLSTVCTQPSLIVFSRRSGLRFRCREWSVDRISLTPKSSPVNLGDHVGVPLCYKISGRRAVL